VASDVLGRIPEVVAALEEQSARFAVIGGFALLAHGIDRPRKDVDFAVSVKNDAVAEGLVLALHERGFRAVQAFEHEETGTPVGVRLLLPGARSTEPECDLLFGTSGVEIETIRAAKAMDLGAVKAPVACWGHLVALKVLAGRTMDRRDVLALVAGARPHDLRAAKKMLELMQERGMAPKRDLAAELRAAQTLVQRLEPGGGHEH
jgi:hypothetical protein